MRNKFNFLIFKIVPLLFVLACAPVQLEAHSYRIEPVQVDLWSTPTLIRVHIQVDSYYWRNAVIPAANKPIPANDWPDEWVELSNSYIQNHFSLSADGEKIPGHFVQVDYEEEPFQGKGGTIHFTLDYNLEAPPEILSGKTQFFLDVYQQEIKENPSIKHDEFTAFVNFTGEQVEKKTVFIEPGTFSTEFSEVLAQPHDRFVRGMKMGGMSLMSKLPVIFFLIAFVLIRPDKKSLTIGGFFEIGVILVILLPISWPRISETVVYISLALLCGLGIKIFSEKLMWIICFFAGILWSFWWGEKLFSSPYSPSPSFHSGVGFLVIQFLGSAGLLLILWMVISGYRYLLRRRSEFVSDRIFQSHRRFALVAITGASIYRILFYYFKGNS